ncbi:LAME_0H09692g1_1 [Lachancea meyersii CBS 8951]|uniref:LAME_0H09692g1_1 n=1 Tax=Lachancea meyersii CBS 8951 TaxID=1266667 RepID=A0A1G4KFY7_9SACH|nr:LAME_0H09692g1_1 [Lachancea meyersii CBS 8951]
MSQAVDNFDPDADSALSAVSRSVVRHILALCESQSNMIAKTRLANIIRDVAKKETIHRAQFSKVYQSVNKILIETFGYQLVGLQPKNSPAHLAADKVQTFMLVTAVAEPPAAYQALLVQEASDMYGSRVMDDHYVGNELQALSETNAQRSVSTDRNLAMQGLTLLVLMLVLLSKNNLLLQELIEGLASFGVPNDGRRIPVVDLTLEDFLKHLVKREYLHRVEENTADGMADVILFRVGRKAQVEFDKSALIETCREIMQLSPEQTDRLKLSIDLNVGDAYKTHVS